VVGLAAFAGLLIGCGDDRDGDPAAMEKTMRGLAAAENAGDPSAAAALMTDAGIAGFYEGASRADLEAGNYEAFGEDPPTIQKLTVDKEDADSGVVTVEVTLGDGYVMQTVDVPMVKQDGVWLIDGFGFGTAAPIAGRPVASIDAVDYGYVVQGDLTSGQASIEFTNKGTEAHEMLLVQVPDGIDVNDAKDAILAMNPEQMDEGYQFVDFLAYAELDAPTQTVNFAKPLPKGHYAVVCFLPVGGGEDGPPHLMEGMITDFTVG
jgi:hypothetical protein